MSEGSVVAEDGLTVQPVESSLKPEIIPAQVVEASQASQAEKNGDDSREDGEKGKTFSDYVDKRIGDGVIEASNFGRELPPERAGEYGLEIKKASLQLIDKLGIEDSLFNDDRYNEAFLTLCDSWVANENSQEPSDQERAFLLQFGRLLSGNKSSFNREAFQRGEEDSGEYFIEASSSKYKRDKAYVDRAREYDHPQKTADFEARVGDFGGDSVFADVRQSLGIASPDQEKPFSVIVVDSYSLSPKDGRIKWADLAGEPGMMQDVGAFVYNDPVTHESTMVIPQEVYDEIIGDDEGYKKTSIGTIKHEYAHTQRSMLLGETDVLGNIFDERMVMQASKGGAPHVDTSIILKTMSKLLPNDGLEVEAQLRKCLTSESARADFLKFVSDRFGLRSTLLLLSIQPDLYREKYGISAVPGVDLGSDHRSSDLLKLVIAERLKIDPDAMERYKKRLSKLDAQEAEMEIFLHRYGKTYLPDELESVIEGRAKAA